MSDRAEGERREDEPKYQLQRCKLTEMCNKGQSPSLLSLIWSLLSDRKSSTAFFTTTSEFHRSAKYILNGRFPGLSLALRLHRLPLGTQDLGEGPAEAAVAQRRPPHAARMIISSVYGAQQTPKMHTMMARDLAICLSRERRAACVERPGAAPPPAAPPAAAAC
ncbi:hypothetical protein EYF80_047669 [Liparis tanakae]|uniref:Uncharacterized protein n=1 Tax=Liparis tanakae TaxID=230148 RepID=A0A4Z2FMM7_9TELE|nr:hypothetical protein EYF80_047669 [Liparis tanakae]